MQADREGRHLEFAEAFDNSEQKKLTIQEVDKYATTTKDDLSPETLKELSVQRATTNGCFFTLKTLIKVYICNILETLAQRENSWAVHCNLYILSDSNCIT